MTSVYQYSLLKYIHSQFLGEELNVGILFYFPDEDKLVFKSPHSLERLKRVYKTFPEKLLKSYLKNFSETAKKYGQDGVHFKDKTLEIIIPNKFIVFDSSSLIFDKTATGVIYKNSDTIISDLFNKYFLDYSEHKTLEEKKHDERFIVHNFHSLIKAKDENIVHYLRGEKKIQTAKALLRVDDHWKNGSTNLVKAVSFDLQEEGEILHKAAQLFGTLNFLNNEFQENNYRCDFIFAAPKKESLLSAYNNALEIVADAKINITLYKESEISNYVTKLASEIHRIS